jgi:hypothetical protein
LHACIECLVANGAKRYTAMFGQNVKHDQQR